MSEQKKVAVVGASGYAGGELLRILSRHPGVQLTVAVSETYAGKPITASFPNLAGHLPQMKFSSYGDGLELLSCDVVFLAQENGKAMHLAPGLIEAGCKVIDLSADFRFRDHTKYEGIYKTTHVSPELNQAAVYGLPELFAEQIKTAQLVGNPGCYPTASLLALAPLIENDLIDPLQIIIDAKSGVSGAGRAKFGLDYHFAEINESVTAYNISGKHRHTPEIEAALSVMTGIKEIPITFTPHLIPITRGMLSTVYAKLTRTNSTEDLLEMYQSRYTTSSFVVISEEGTLPATKHTLGSNRCHIGLSVDNRTNRVTVISVIDNLVKGAAGQAVQNLNLMCGFEETAGLLEVGGVFP